MLNPPLKGCGESPSQLPLSTLPDSVHIPSFFLFLYFFSRNGIQRKGSIEADLEERHLLTPIGIRLVSLDKTMLRVYLKSLFEESRFTDVSKISRGRAGGCCPVVELYPSCTGL